MKLRCRSTTGRGRQTPLEALTDSMAGTTISAPTVKPRCRFTNSRGRRLTVDYLTTLMANASIPAPAIKRKSTEHREYQPSAQDSTTGMANGRVGPSPATMHQSPTNLLPPANLLLPPTSLTPPPANASEMFANGGIALNCRSRLPNSYLTVYHHRGHRMLCVPWEMPWEEDDEEAI